MKKLLAILLVLSVIFIISCATTPRNDDVARTAAPVGDGGVWHRVRKGETLWRIAKAYRVSLEDIKRVNDLDDVVHIDAGTWVRIPGAEELLHVQGEQPDAVGESVDFSWPLQGEIVRGYGKLENDFSYGIDIRSGVNRDIVASEDGVVALAGVIRGYGNTIIIEHGNNFTSLYAQNIRSLVREGQRVKKNTVIARSENLHDTMHFEIFFKGKPVNPLIYLP
jgi:lipoprotein YgeR